MEVVLLVLVLAVGAVAALVLWQVMRAVRRIPTKGQEAYGAWSRFFDRHLWNREQMREILGDDLTDKLS